MSYYDRERLRRGWTHEEAAAQAGIALKTWRRIVNGEPVRGISLAKVERLFQEEPGSEDDAAYWKQRALEAEAKLRAIAALADAPAPSHPTPEEPGD